MFKKILIANRGEIACRAIKSARKMGIATVAVYSDADMDALHKQMADEAVHIGPPPASESYLVMDKIIDACKQTGAEAVYPGYGFLSENAEFARRLAEAGIAFIGPNVKAIEVMGDKIESKKFAAEAKVNTVPGFLGILKDGAEAVKVANEIGYPVMIKASAGGGGKGMRIAWNDAEAAEGFDLAVSEAKSSFGDDRVFVEKFVTNPRHIEIQVLADKSGNTIYLNERECSIQRRNQKVIEEAPSPFLDEETRKAMGEQAVALAKAVDYESAGTVEFIVDGDKNFYFLEMNTRLQVEHPVTELITGVDLVEQMIKVAAGLDIDYAQADIKINGWAIESRLYAEDPFRNFLPSIGRLVRYRPPEEGQEDGLTIRNDTGVYEGSEISMFYDPMIAKLCTHGPTREAAIDHMMYALDDFEVAGIGHNIPFLSAVMQHERFRSGNITTGFIAEEYPDGFEGAPVTEDLVKKVAAVAGFIKVADLVKESLISDQLSEEDFELKKDWVFTVNGETFEGEMSLDTDGVEVVINGESVMVCSDWLHGDTVFNGTVRDEEVTVQVARSDAGYKLYARGAFLDVSVRRPEHAALAALMPIKEAPDTSKMLLCPMPGLIVSINVNVGDEVEPGQNLAVVEAMKMENVLRAENKAKVVKINAAQGDSLAVDEVIMEFE